jgi:anti-sigma factor RsiW
MAVNHPTRNLLAYLRGELAPSERNSLEAHLARCAQCRAETAALKDGLQLIAQGIAELPKPDWNEYRAELRRKLLARSNPPSWWPYFNLLWGSLVAAGVAAALFVSFSTLRQSARPPAVANSAPMMDQLAMADVMSHTDVGMFRDYPVVERLDMLENYDVIEHLDELSPAPPQTHATTRHL